MLYIKIRSIFNWLRRSNYTTACKTLYLVQFEDEQTIIKAIIFFWCYVFKVIKITLGLGKQYLTHVCVRLYSKALKKITYEIKNKIKIELTHSLDQILGERYLKEF